MAATCPTGIVSEGDTQLKAALARSNFGVDGTGVKVGCSVGVAGGSVLDVITKYWVNSRVKIKKSATDRIMIRPIRTIFRTVFSPKALVRFS